MGATPGQATKERNARLLMGSPGNARLFAQRGVGRLPGKEKRKCKTVVRKRDGGRQPPGRKRETVAPKWNGGYLRGGEQEENVRQF